MTDEGMCMEHCCNIADRGENLSARRETCPIATFWGTSHMGWLGNEAGPPGLGGGLNHHTAVASFGPLCNCRVIKLLGPFCDVVHTV